jgi:hypothetical protein
LILIACLKLSGLEHAFEAHGGHEQAPPSRARCYEAWSMTGVDQSRDRPIFA